VENLLWKRLWNCRKTDYGMNEKPHLLAIWVKFSIRYLYVTLLNNGEFRKNRSTKGRAFQRNKCPGKVCTTPRITPAAVFLKCGINHCTKSYEVQFLIHTQKKLRFQRISAVSRTLQSFIRYNTWLPATTRSQHSHRLKRPPSLL
jgi:hypothetical protein